MRKKRVDNFFLGIIISLIVIGFFVFISASLGVLAKNEDKFYNILWSQLVLGFGLGLFGMFIASKINYKFWRKYSLYIFLGSIALTLLVFVPGLGLSHAGARRWIDIGLTSFQPVEFLKFGFIIYFAAWLSWARAKVQNFKYILPLLIFLAIIALILFKQPDTKSFLLIMVSGMAMFFLSGVPWKYIFAFIGLSVVALGTLIYFEPYLLDRVETFIDPNRDPQGSSYQLQQSLIAIGSGGWSGRGFGQSIQKFSYLPEPQGDSIFAVIGEEFGFIGSIIVILLYMVFAQRGLRIANRSPDLFSRLLTTGIVILITTQAFLNIASIIGVFPLTGVPLPFISHGGTSLAITLIAVGIVLNISKYQKV